MEVKYPDYQEELERLVVGDQDEIRSHYQRLKELDSETDKARLNLQLKQHCHARAERMMEILDEIKEPTINEHEQSWSTLLKEYYTSDFHRSLEANPEFQQKLKELGNLR